MENITQNIGAVLFLSLIAHLIGDYLLQSGWMANNKTKENMPALAHAFVYSLLFMFLVSSFWGWFVVFGTHFAIDRWRLVRYVVYAKELLGTPSSRPPWAECSVTGYHKDVPVWLAVWLMIIVDNTLHLVINTAVILLGF